MGSSVNEGLSFTLEGEASHGPGAPFLLLWTLAAVSEPPPRFHGDPDDLSTKHSVGALQMLIGQLYQA